MPKKPKQPVHLTINCEVCGERPVTRTFSYGMVCDRESCRREAQQWDKKMDELADRLDKLRVERRRAWKELGDG